MCPLAGGPDFFLSVDSNCKASRSVPGDLRSNCVVTSNHLVPCATCDLIFAYTGLDNAIIQRQAR